MDAIMQAMQDATRRGCDYIKSSARALNEKQQQREKVKRAYIAAHGDLVGLVLYLEHLQKEDI